MDRKLFKKEFDKASEQLDKRKMRYVIKEIEKKGEDAILNRLYLIAMEELAELQQEISRLARRGWDSKIGLLEEMADVCIIMERLKRRFDISTTDLYKAINVKIDRCQKVLDEKGEYL